MFSERHKELDIYNQLFVKLDEPYYLYESGLPATDTGILYHLYVSENACTQKEICEWTWGNKQTVNSAIKRLMQAELITMERSQINRREKLIALTEKGYVLVQEKIEPLVIAEEQAILRMGKSAYEEYFRLMELHAKFLKEEILKLK